MKNGRRAALTSPEGKRGVRRLRTETREGLNLMPMGLRPATAPVFVAEQPLGLFHPIRGFLSRF